MNVITPLISNLQSPKVIQPGERPLCYPPVSSETLAGINSTSGYSDLDAPCPQRLSTSRIVISLIAVQFVRTSARPTSRSTNRLDSVKRFCQHHRVVNIGGGNRYRKRDAFPVDHNMALRARFAAIRRVRACCFAPPGAATLAESSEARDQSILSAIPSSSRSSLCSLCQTPAICQSLSRRQQVMPLPQPISWGRYSQGMPVLSTKSMPVRAARSGVLGLPPFGFGGSRAICDQLYLANEYPQ
jgi:hypothetical protein